MADDRGAAGRAANRAAMLARQEQYKALRDDGKKPDEATRELGVSAATGRRYEIAYRQATGRPPGLLRDGRGRPGMRSRIEEYKALRDEGKRPDEAACALKVSPRTGDRYERWYRLAADLPASPPRKPLYYGGDRA